MMASPSLDMKTAEDSHNSGRSALNAANDPAQMSGECDQQHGAKCKEHIDDSRRSLWISQLANTPPAKHPNHSAPCKCERQMQEHVALKLSAFHLPVPCVQYAPDA